MLTAPVPSFMKPTTISVCDAAFRASQARNSLAVAKYVGSGFKACVPKQLLPLTTG